MRVLRSVWRVLDARQRRRLIGLQALSVLMAASTVAGIASVLPFFTAISDPSAAARFRLLGPVLRLMKTSDPASVVVTLGATFAAVVLVANVVNLFGFLAIGRFAFEVGESLHVRLFREYMQRDYQFHARHSRAMLTTKVLDEVGRVTNGIVLHGLVLVTNVVTIAFVAASIALVNPLVAGCAIATLGASYAAIYFSARRRLLRNGRRESSYRAERAKTVEESFADIKEITILQAGDFFVRRFADQSRSLSHAAWDTLAIAQSPKYVLECITVFSLVGVALYLRSQPGGGAWMAELSFVGLAAYRLLPALHQSFAAVARIRADQAALAAIEADLYGDGVATDGEARASALLDRTADARLWRGRPHREIRLCEVAVRYGSDRAACLSGLSLALPAGSMVGLVGPNGSGKTTLVDLVSGLLVAQSGHVEIDGIKLDRSNRAAWQANVAYVPQRVFVFDATVAENIACGVEPAQIDFGRVEIAARLAQLAEFVASLPGKYLEPLGDEGCRLSGGQRQRLAIARALYRDASLLILDEATSALDTGAEADIAATLAGLRGDRTILIVAHRAGALHHCDRVFELRDGRITGVGSYSELASRVTARIA